MDGDVLCLDLAAVAVTQDFLVPKYPGRSLNNKLVQALPLPHLNADMHTILSNCFNSE
jgi:hypothetical protein